MAAADTRENKTAGVTGEVSDFVRTLCVADTNASIYGVEHPVALTAVRAAFEALSTMLSRRREAVTLSLGDDGLIFSGLPLETRNPHVARVVAKLSAMKVAHLSFSPGLSETEFACFLRILSQGDKGVGTNTVAALLTARGVRHIAVRNVSYVLVTDDQRVVSKRARVESGGRISAREGEEQIVGDVARNLLRQKRSRDWLVQQAKNNPAKMATMLAGLLDEAIRGQTGEAEQRETIENVIDNIKLLGSSLRDEQSGETMDDAQIREAVLMVENEIKTRSRQLVSTGGSRRIIGEILNVVATVTDPLKSLRANDWFVKDEATLRRTEELIRGHQGETSRENADTPARTPEPAGAAPARPARKTGVRVPAAVADDESLFEQVLGEGLDQSVAQLGIFGSDRDNAIAQLRGFVADMVNKRSSQYRNQAKRFSGRVGRQGVVLDDAISVGVVIWDQDGAIEYINEAVEKCLRAEPLPRLRPEILRELAGRTFPTGLISPREAELKGWSVAEYRFLSDVHKVIRDDTGLPVAAIVKRPAA